AGGVLDAASHQNAGPPAAAPLLLDLVPPHPRSGPSNSVRSLHRITVHTVPVVHSYMDPETPRECTSEVSEAINLTDDNHELHVPLAVPVPEQPSLRRVDEFRDCMHGAAACDGMDRHLAGGRRHARRATAGAMVEERLQGAAQRGDRDPRAAARRRRALRRHHGTGPPTSCIIATYWTRQRDDETDEDCAM
ncbi:unnamed protein product, partial [Urochloa humidicola]